MVGLVSGIRIEWLVDQQRCQKEPAAEMTVQQHGVFAEPAEPRPSCEVPFQQRCGIDDAAGAAAGQLAVYEIGQFRQAFSQNVVVIAGSGGVASHPGGDRRGRGVLLDRGLSHARLVGRTVEHSEHDEAGRIGQYPVGVVVRVASTRQVAHLPVESRVEPVAEVIEALGPTGRGDADQFESDSPGLGANRLGNGTPVDGRGGRGVHDGANRDRCSRPAASTCSAATVSRGVYWGWRICR